MKTFKPNNNIGQFFQHFSSKTITKREGTQIRSGKENIFYLLPFYADEGNSQHRVKGEDVTDLDKQPNCRATDDFIIRFRLTMSHYFYRKAY